MGNKRPKPSTYFDWSIDPEALVTFSLASAARVSCFIIIKFTINQLLHSGLRMRSDTVWKGVAVSQWRWLSVLWQIFDSYERADGAASATEILSRMAPCVIESKHTEARPGHSSQDGHQIKQRPAETGRNINSSVPSFDFHLTIERSAWS